MYVLPLLLVLSLSYKWNRMNVRKGTYFSEWFFIQIGILTHIERVLMYWRMSPLQIHTFVYMGVTGPRGFPSTFDKYT